jgi:hypothetical protein
MVGSQLSVGTTAAAPAEDTSFDISQAFGSFMQSIGSSPDAAGGEVTFTGADPLLRSHFRIGASMAIPAMSAGVGAAAIWRDRTGQEQDLSLDLRDAVWNVNPMVGMVLRMQQGAGQIPGQRSHPEGNDLRPQRERPAGTGTARSGPSDVVPGVRNQRRALHESHRRLPASG